MNNPPRKEDISRNAVGVIGLCITLIAYGVVIAVWVSQTNTNFSDRLKFLEEQQALSRGIEDKLNTAREESNTHFATTDLKLGDLEKNVTAILEVLKDMGSQGDGGTQMSAPPNFPARHPGR